MHFELRATPANEAAWPLSSEIGDLCSTPPSHPLHVSSSTSAVGEHARASLFSGVAMLARRTVLYNVGTDLYYPSM